MGLLFCTIGLFFLLILLYLFFLAAAGLWPEKPKEHNSSQPSRFAIIIPAHNESSLIQKTLTSIKETDYPANLYKIFVVADNCDDNTADISRQAGAVCWEREDKECRGKGFAVKFAFEHLLDYENQTNAHSDVKSDRFDADTLMDRNYLKALNQRLKHGAKAIQSNAVVLHPERSPMESLAYLGSVLNRSLRYKGRTRLGWTTNLTGTMCFSSDVIRKLGWIATSIVEDIEYTMFLHLNDVRVEFAPEAKIYIEIPQTFRGAEGQRKRWDRGKFQIRNKYLPKMIMAGIKKRDFSYFDSAMELFIPPFSLFAALAILCFFLFLMMGFHCVNMCCYIWFSVMIGLGIYIMAGLILAKTSMKVYLNLLYAPYFLLWRCWIIAQDIFSKKKLQW